MLSLSSVIFAGLFARILGITSLNNRLTFTSVTASDCGRDASRLDTGCVCAGREVRPRVCVRASCAELARSSASVVNVNVLLITTKPFVLVTYIKLVGRL